LKHAPCNGSFTDMNSTERTKHSKHVKHPQNDGDDNHNVQDLLNLVIHRDVVVHEPQQNPNHNQNYHKLDQIHD
jgi:hypothetical protein